VFRALGTAAGRCARVPPNAVSGLPGSLQVVATPIGNLGDLSRRALDVLASADVICCEDTRRTRALLAAESLPSSPRRLLSLHGHNEATRIGQVLELLRAGRTVALVSDAGTPTISDPGARLVAAAVDAGYGVSAVPGPCAPVSALVVSGLPTERFCFEGFLPRKGPERRRRLAELASEERTAVILEAPGRLAMLLADLQGAMGDRRVAVCRELTKVHEEVWRGRLADAATHFGQQPVRGEVVVVVEGRSAPVASQEALSASVRAHLAGGDSPRQAAEATAAELGVSRRRAYAEALAQRDRDGRSGLPSGPR